MKGDKKIVDILNDQLAGELTAVDRYLMHGEMCCVSRDLTKGLRERCEEAIDWLETQQSLIKEVALQNCLQTQMQPVGA